MLLYDDVRMMLQDHVRIGVVDQDRLVILFYDVMALYEKAGEDLPRTVHFLDIIDVLNGEKEVSKCLSEEIDELTEKLEEAERTIAELRQRLNEAGTAP